MNKILEKANTLSFKMILIISTLFMLFSLFNLLYIPSKIKSEMNNNELQKAGLVGNLVSSALGAGIYFYDQESIVNETNKLFNVKNILFVILTNDKDSLIFSKKRNIASKLQYQINNRNSFISDTLLFSVTNINFNQKYLGRIHIGYSLSETINNGKRQSVIFMIFSLFTFIIGIGLSIVISNFITRQLNAIIKTARNVKQGDFSKRVTITSKDEVGLLARNFNDMLDNLEELYSDLEKKVNLRTEELKQTNLILQSEIMSKEAASQQLRELLAEKEVILKEIHHRVKNNLQVISSLLYLQSNKSTSIENQEILNDSQNRIKAMALVHEQLYKSEDLTGILLPEYIRSLVNAVIKSNNSNSKIIRLNIKVEDIFLSLDKSIPFGLIVNEIVTNSLKYAFEGKLDGILKINIIQDENDNIITLISDNGIGMPQDLDISRTKSLGLKLVQTLVAQLEGTFEIVSVEGTEFRIIFSPNDKKIKNN